MVTWASPLKGCLGLLCLPAATHGSPLLTPTQLILPWGEGWRFISWQPCSKKNPQKTQQDPSWPGLFFQPWIKFKPQDVMPMRLRKAGFWPQRLEKTALSQHSADTSLAWPLSSHCQGQSCPEQGHVITIPVPSLCLFHMHHIHHFVQNVKFWIWQKFKLECSHFTDEKIQAPKAEGKCSKPYS